MIVIQLKNGCVSVKGHAQFGEAGRDVVCAGVSALVCTLAENLRRRGIQVEVAPGRAVLPIRGNEQLWADFALGFQLLAEEYPQWVKVLW